MLLMTDVGPPWMKFQSRLLNLLCLPDEILACDDDD
jgi:hypothetical protein